MALTRRYFSGRVGVQARLEWGRRRKSASEYRPKFGLQTRAEKRGARRNMNEEWGGLVKMGTSCANNKSYQGSGPILCPRLLAPGLGTPPPWATPPSSTCGDVPPEQGGGRTHAQTLQTVYTSPPSRGPAFLRSGACAPPLRSRISEAGAWGPPALRSRHPPGGGVRRKGGVPDRDPYLPTEPRVEQARRAGNCDGGSKRAVPLLFRVCRWQRPLRSKIRGRTRPTQPFSLLWA